MDNSLTCYELEIHTFEYLFGTTNIADQSWVIFGCVGDPHFTYSDNNHKILRSCDSPNLTVVVPARVTELESDVFSLSPALTVSFAEGSQLHILHSDSFREAVVQEVILPPSFILVPDNFMRGCRNLTRITFHGWVKTLSVGCFSYCWNLVSIKFDSDEILKDTVLDFSGSYVQEISHSTFDGVNISSIIFHSQITNYLNFSFHLIRGLKSVDLPVATHILPDYLFNGSTLLEKIIIGDEVIFSDHVLDLRNTPVTDIFQHAFNGIQIEKILLSGSYYIHDTAFLNCPINSIDLTLSIDQPLEIPSSLLTIPHLTSFVLNGVESHVEGGLDLSQSGFSKIATGWIKTSIYSRISLPNTLTSVPPALFQNNDHFISISLPFIWPTFQDSYLRVVKC